MFDDFSYSENQNEYTLYRNQVRIILTNLIDNTGLLEISMFLSPLIGSPTYLISFQSIFNLYYVHIYV